MVMMHPGECSGAFFFQQEGCVIKDHSSHLPNFLFLTFWEVFFTDPVDICYFTVTNTEVHSVVYIPGYLKFFISYIIIIILGN